jgi:DNA polymerase III subunit epsilon
VKNGLTGSWIALCAVAFAATMGAVALAPDEPAWLAGALGGAASALLVSLLWFGYRRLVVAPSGGLVRSMRRVRESQTQDLEFLVARSPALLPLITECEAFAATLRQTRREARDFAQAEAAEMGGQKAWLESILQNLTEGVFVCNPQHRIMLYNAAAVSLVGLPERVGLGRDLGGALDVGPLNHSLSGLELRHEADPGLRHESAAPFVCSTADGGRVFHGRMALLIAASGAVSGYVVTLVDGSQEHALLAGGDTLRHTLSAELAPLLEDIRRAGDRLSAGDELPPQELEALARVAADAGRDAHAMAMALDASIRDLIAGHATMVDIHAVDLVKLLQKKLPSGCARVSLIGTPLWLLADSLSLVEALEALVLEISATRGPDEIFLETVPTGAGLDLALSWMSENPSDQEFEGWLELACVGSGEHQRLRHVLERHATHLEVVPASGERNGALRIPLRAPRREREAAAPRRHPPRPEFYDANLMAGHQGDAEIAKRRLCDLRFVVFDCEMTGLRPNHGDEIVQIAAVPVVRKRLLSGEGMEWIVNPGRPIPPSSIKFHGLTDADVADKPPIAEVLAEFRAYAADAVLVAHNAAFDLRFISLKEKLAGVAFDNPVLDTMLISKLLDETDEDHSLDGLIERYGVPIVGRHSALGDTIATADLLIRMIERLEAKGIATFGEVLRETNMVAELRHRTAVFAHGTGTGG